MRATSPVERRFQMIIVYAKDAFNIRFSSNRRTVIAADFRAILFSKAKNILLHPSVPIVAQ